MPLASGSRTQLYYHPEVTFGVLNGTGNVKKLRRTDDTLSFSTQTQTSQEIRSDRQTTDLVLVGASAEGAVNFELSHGEYDPLIEALLMGAPVVYGTNGVGATFSAATFTTSSITGTALPITNLVKGQWVRILAPSTVNDGKVAQISRTVAPTATAISFEGTPFTAIGTSTANCVIQTTRFANPSTAASIVQKSFTLEREHADIGQFVLFRGMTVGKMSLSFQSGSIVTGSFEFMGKDQVLNATRQTPGTPVESKLGEVMNAVSGVGNILEAGAPLTGTYIKSLTLDVDNALRGRDAIGVLGNAEIAAGTLAVTGSMSVYFANATLYNKFITSAATSVSFSAQDASGNGYVFQLPRVKFNEGNIVSGNKDSDSMVDMTFTALMDTTTTSGSYLQTIVVDRIGVAVT